MAYDLKGMARRAGERGIITLNPIYPTKALSDDLARIYIRIFRVWRDAANDALLPLYSRELARLTTDADHAGVNLQDDVSDMEAEIAAAEARATAVIAALGITVEAWERRMAEWHGNQFAAYVKQATGIDVSLLISSQEIEDALRATLAENLRLIRSVSDEARDRIGGSIWRGFLARTPRRNVAREINEALGLGRARSVRIAVDQSTKLSAALDHERQTEAGFAKFRWRHSGKKHFRPEHKARDGKIYAWTSNVAKTDPPGHKPFCGCKAQAVLDLGDD